MAGRLAASTCWPPLFLSPTVKERGDHIMRRVVTGEQIAQLRNPDPFAVPAWRSPVYRTPLWIVAIVHAARLLARLVRFLARHPVRVLAAVFGVLVWHMAGWPGLVILAVTITAVLAMWRWRFPASFSQ